MKSLAFGLEIENYYSGHTSGLVLEVSNDTLSVEEKGRTTCCPPHWIKKKYKGPCTDLFLIGQVVGLVFFFLKKDILIIFLK